MGVPMLGQFIRTTDPAFNLALEDHLFQTLPDDHPGLFLLWQNAPSIIIGRHQCAAEEIDQTMVERLCLPVVRRMTGGGAVYHDLGNLNFSWICAEAPGRPMRQADFARFLEPVCDALARLGVLARLSGRNDLEVLGKKVSGSSQRRLPGRLLHHGTLLVYADLDFLGQVLKPSPEKISSKGVASVRARVGNLADHWRPGCNLGILAKTIMDAVVDAPARLDIRPGSDLHMAAMRLAFSKYGCRKWNFLASPPYTLEKKQRFDFGTVCLRLDIAAGQIRQVGISGDFFASLDPEELARSLCGCPATRQDLTARLAEVAWQEYFSGCEPSVMTEFFISAIPG